MADHWFLIIPVKLIDEMPYFEESMAYYDLEDKAGITFQHPSTLKTERESDIEQIHQAPYFGHKGLFL